MLLSNVFQEGGRSARTGSELVCKQLISANVSLNAHANVYHRNIDAFSVVNPYPVPVRYSSARQQLTSGNAKLNAVIKFPREW